MKHFYRYLAADKLMVNNGLPRTHSESRMTSLRWVQGETLQ